MRVSFPAAPPWRIARTASSTSSASWQLVIGGGIVGANAARMAVVAGWPGRSPRRLIGAAWGGGRGRACSCSRAERPGRDRLVGALLIEPNDEWPLTRGYLSSGVERPGPRGPGRGGRERGGVTGAMREVPASPSHHSSRLDSDSGARRGRNRSDCRRRRNLEPPAGGASGPAWIERLRARVVG